MFVFLGAVEAFAQTSGPSGGGGSYGSSEDGKGCGLIGCINMIAAGQALSVASMHDMKGGRWVFLGTFSNWKADNVLNPDGPDGNARVDTSGTGVSFALKREFTSHWGGGLIGSFSTGKDIELGTLDAGLAPDDAESAGFGGPGGRFSDHHSHFLAVMFTWDPFDNPDGFRLPISAGPAHFWQGLTYQNGAESAIIERNTMGLFANVSLDFLIGEFRIMPGVLYINMFGGTESTENGDRVPFDYVTPGGSFSGLYDGPDNAGSIYTTFRYRPLNVSFNWTLPVLDLKRVQMYSLTWNKEWGGGKPDIAPPDKSVTPPVPPSVEPEASAEPVDPEQK